MKETIVNINKTESWYFKKLKKNNIDKPLARLIKKKERRIKSTKSEMKRSSCNRQCINTKDYKRLL